MEIKTERLIIRPITLNDASFILELVNTKKWINNIGQRNVHSIDDAETYIQTKMIDHYTKHGYGNFVMMRKNDRVIVGSVSLFNRQDVEGVDIGFAVKPCFFRQGYAYEGAVSIMKHARDELKLSSIIAFTSKKNIASQNLILRLGLEYEGTIIFGEKKEELLNYKLVF